MPTARSGLRSCGWYTSFQVEASKGTQSGFDTGRRLAEGAWGSRGPRHLKTRAGEKALGAVEVAMAISREQVEHVAHLARLGLTDEETDRLQQQLSQILGHMQMIDQLDTSAIPPTAQVIPVTTVMRDDEARPSLPVEEILKNAPRREGDFFKVPPVLE